MREKTSPSCFNAAQKKVASELLLSLPSTEFRAVFLRFWGDFSVADISRELCVDWERADAILYSGLNRLRPLCLSHPAFAERELNSSSPHNNIKPI